MEGREAKFRLSEQSSAVAGMLLLCISLTHKTRPPSLYTGELKHGTAKRLSASAREMLCSSANLQASKMLFAKICHWNASLFISAVPCMGRAMKSPPRTSV